MQESIKRPITKREYHRQQAHAIWAELDRIRQEYPDPLHGLNHVPTHLVLAARALRRASQKT